MPPAAPTSTPRRAAPMPLVRGVPALAALLYPTVIWAGPAISPWFLAVALAVPAAGIVAVHRVRASHRRACAVALATVAAPALYSWLGGLLDFQTVVPIRALTLWYPGWTALAIVAATDAGAPESPRPPRPSRLAFLHGGVGAVIALFAIAHLANHLAGLWGGAAHVAVMQALRVVYRQPLVEAVLLGAIAVQAASGLRLLRAHADRPSAWWDTAQLASGAYLGAFFLSHLTAALRARWLRGVDTNWQWLTADSMLTDPWSARLAPYYALGIVAFGVHAAAGLRYVMRGRGWPTASADRAAAVLAFAATLVSALVMTGLLRG